MVKEGDGVDAIQALARKYWAKPKPNKATQNALKEIWEALEQRNFDVRCISVLEQSQILEKWLWPQFTEDAAQHHLLLILLVVQMKAKANVNINVWAAFEQRPDEFSSLFRRVLSMSLDTSLKWEYRLSVLAFILTAFKSLDNATIRKQCAPLVSIGIWQLMTEPQRQAKLEKDSELRRAWKAAGKRHDTADDEGKAKIKFDQRWLFSLTMELIGQLYSAGDSSSLSTNYCERVLELLVDLVAQLPTRRYTRALLQDVQVLPLVKLSLIYNDPANDLVRDLYQLLAHYMDFPLNDYTGRSLTLAESEEEHNGKLATLQKVSYSQYREKLQLLILAHDGQLEQRDELNQLLEPLSDTELSSLCQSLNLRIEFPALPKHKPDRALLLEILLFHHERRPSFRDRVRKMPILPTENLLYDTSLSRAERFTDDHPLALPKQNLQYLAMEDLQWRSFVLHRCESYYAIRRDIEQILKKLQPRTSVGKPGVTFGGFARMALPISRPAVIEVVSPKIGEAHPSLVRAEIALDVSRLEDSVRRDWETLRSDDVVYLLAVSSPKEMTNGHSQTDETRRRGFLRHLRCAQVIQVYDDRGRHLRDERREQSDGYTHHRPRIRKLHVKLDARAYQADIAGGEGVKMSVYDGINLIIRRRGRENNFKSVLQSIQDLTLSEAQVPEWLREVLLGYGDPSSASFERLERKSVRIDFRDTFLDWNHLQESFPGASITQSSGSATSLKPPYVLQISRSPSSELQVMERPSKKKRHLVIDETTQDGPVMKVSSYSPPNAGPYPASVPKRNQIRFTPAQISAINSGCRPGLTLIVGPPGTGKTDVAVQIISNIYHNCPTERTLLVAHSNQALNQLFQKIVDLDINPRHLLRLGRGEEELERGAAGSFGKVGRVESFMESRDQLLYEVNRLAASLSAPGVHAQSCETADYFDIAYIIPAWNRFLNIMRADDFSCSTIIEKFPFHTYFWNAPQPLFPEGGSKEEVTAVAEGCYSHIRCIFSDLAEIRPFELLRTDRHKSSYLLSNSARIIAMTSTHAAIHRREIADSGLQYHNLVMEEAAQITEIETFIPMALQKSTSSSGPSDDEDSNSGSALERVVLIGDHLQNAPIVLMPSLSAYANMDQSLFARLMRLGVPRVLLNAQGRARPSLAALWSWRYPGLTSLPSITTPPTTTDPKSSSPSSSSAFTRANPALKYTSQFIDVGPLHNRGESTLPNTPGAYQNLAEAEYAVALYQYLRLHNYPARQITLLTPYAAQRSLLRDVLRRRCAGPHAQLFGLPAHVGTVDRYQGEQNAYVILSLVRTRDAGYLRDLRRMTVAMSRARLGLYVLGCRKVFEACREVEPFLEGLWRGGKPDRLVLRRGERWPGVEREEDEVDVRVDEGKGDVLVRGVEDLGRIVYELTVRRVEELKSKGLSAGAGAVRQREAGSGGADAAPVVEEEEDWTSSSGISEDGDDEETEEKSEGEAEAAEGSKGVVGA